MKNKTWLWILLGLVAIGVVGCFTLVGTGVYVVRKNMKVTPATAESAQDEFARVRAQFADQEPLVQITGSEHATPDLEQRLRDAPKAPEPISAMHVMVWEEKEGRVVRVSLPMWLIRMGNRDSFKVDAGGASIERIRISPQDLERLGPTLLVDHRDRRSRVLVWTE